MYTLAKKHANYGFIARVITYNIGIGLLLQR
jgi:hypothetical protein